METQLFKEVEERKKNLVASYVQYADSVDYAAELVEAGKEFLERDEYEPGQLVMWKKHMQTHAIPLYGRPMVFLGMKDDSEETDKLLAKAYVGVIDGEGDFVVLDIQVGRLCTYVPPNEKG